MGHWHDKMLKRYQSALLEHDFIIQYKKGSNMPGTICPDFWLLKNNTKSPVLLHLTHPNISLQTSDE